MIERGERAQHLLGRARELLRELVRALAGDDRDGRVAGGVAEPDAQRLPRRGRRILGEAERELAGVAERRRVGLARPRAEHVHRDQTQGAADRRVRPVALPERVVARVHPDLRRDRPADDHAEGGAARARQHGVQVERRVEHRLERRDDDGEVLGPAARHHRVRRRLLERHTATARRHEADEQLGIVAPTSSSIASTRAGVGGTIGRPSVQPRRKNSSWTSCSSSVSDSDTPV